MNHKEEKKRRVDLVVISDVHLGTYGCHAKELVRYMKSIKPKKVILNGDIIDIWQFSKNYWPASHMKVVKYLMGLITKGTSVYYITGNHDEMLRKFSGAQLDNFHLEDKLVLELDGKRFWFFHGDVFDVTMKHSKWLAKIGGAGYDMLILFNRFINYLLKKAGREKISLSKKVKDSVKAAVKHISDFEQTAADIAVREKYDYVICGHIHEPAMRKYDCKDGSVHYLNSGDWIENLTALEYNNGEWSLMYYNQLVFEQEFEAEISVRELSSDIVELQTTFIKHRELAKVC